MLEIGYYLLSFVAIAMLLLLFRSYPLGKVIVRFSAVMLCWISYLMVLTQTGVLRNFELPPRVPMLIVIPAILLIIMLVNRKFMKIALETTPLYVPIALQSFRILVELLIYATYQGDIFPQKATFEGLNFDILVGMSAIFMSVATFKRSIRNNGILIWNLASISILLLTVYSFISSYYFSEFGTSTKGFYFVEFPYLLLASVLLPIAVFLHAFSIKQLLKEADKAKMNEGRNSLLEEIH